MQTSCAPAAEQHRHGAEQTKLADAGLTLTLTSSVQPHGKSKANICTASGILHTTGEEGNLGTLSVARPGHYPTHRRGHVGVSLQSRLAWLAGGKGPCSHTGFA